MLAWSGSAEGDNIVALGQFNDDRVRLPFGVVVFLQLAPQPTALTRTIVSVRASKDSPRSKTSTPSEYSFSSSTLPSIVRSTT